MEDYASLGINTGGDAPNSAIADVASTVPSSWPRGCCNTGGGESAAFVEGPGGVAAFVCSYLAEGGLGERAPRCRLPAGV